MKDKNTNTVLMKITQNDILRYRSKYKCKKLAYWRLYESWGEKLKRLEETRSQIASLNIVEMSILPKLICRFNVILYQNPSKSFFVETDKIIPNFIWTCKGTRILKTMLEKYIAKIIQFQNSLYNSIFLNIKYKIIYLYNSRED